MIFLYLGLVNTHTFQENTQIYKSNMINMVYLYNALNYVHN